MRSYRNNRFETSEKKMKKKILRGFVVIHTCTYHDRQFRSANMNTPYVCASRIDYVCLNIFFEKCLHNLPFSFKGRLAGIFALLYVASINSSFSFIIRELQLRTITKNVGPYQNNCKQNYTKE
jgi:hypothetical protein